MRQINYCNYMCTISSLACIRFLSSFVLDVCSGDLQVLELGTEDIVGGQLNSVQIIP